MPPPKGMRSTHFTVKNGDTVFIYSNGETLILQLRHEVPTQEDILSASFKAAIELSDDDAIAIAGELLTAVSLRKKERAKKEKENG